MIGKLIERPIAVTMAIVALVVLGVVSIGLLPISLMPNVDIPQITIQFSYKGASAREVNDVVIKQMRQQLIQLSDLEELTCTANNGGGIIFMQFDYGSDTDLNFIEVNEKIDRLLPSLPKDMERPRIIKASATDIPVFFIDLTIDEQSDEAFIELSKFAREVIVKRIEQIPQVAMVDVSGILGSQFVIEPDMGKLLSLGLKVEDLERAITDNNVSLGNLSIKDGYYQWNIRFDSQIDEVSDIENINLKINGRIYLFKDLADVKEEPADVSGMVRSAGKRAVTFAVLKQSDARMADLQVEIDRLMESFHTDYPDIDFTITRNQTELLDYSIDNLKSNIIVGAILAIIIIFLFMRDLRSPVLICITIPLSLIVSLLMLYVLGISINIISLSGLILGMGMMVDNSIIVIDNITQRRERGDSFKYAIAKGTSEVFAPMLSSVLTTCAVFVPLIFLSGIAGALFYDQAMAVTTALFSSLFVAVLVIPVYYRLLYRKEENLSGAALVKSQKERAYHRIYEKSVFWIFRHPKTSWAIFLSFIPLTFIFYGILDKSKLPPLTHTESVLSIEWNEPTNVVASDARIMDLLNRFDSEILEYSVLVGTQDFMLSHTPNQEISQVSVYMKAESMEKLTELEGKIAEYLDKKYAGVSYDFKQAANIFNLIFSDNEPTLVAMIRGREGNVPQPDELNAFLEKIGKRLPEIYLEPVLWQEEILYVVDKEKMALIGGNTSKGPLSITISAYGYVAKGCAMRRDLAKPGDIIYVSGNLGMGGLFVKAGYHELNLASDLFSIVHKKAQLIPSRTVFARALRRVCRCALDVSDGTVGDLRHILERSNVGAVLNLDKLPLDEIFDQVNLTALEKVELAAFGGCDYELLFTVNPKKISLLEKIAACHRVKITPIGVITKDKNLNLLFENKPYVKANRPFEHF